MKRKFRWYGVIVFSILLAACSKDPGEGGDASISGEIWVRHYNATFTTLIGEFPAEDQYVYIIYGDHPGFDARVKTSYDGTFEFPYLNKGQYEIYVYSLDSTLTDLSELVPVIRKVEIKERKENVDIGRITIFE